MIDSSIAMGYKPVQLENPMNQLAQLMQIRAAQSQYDVGQQGIQETNKLNALYSGAVGADGKIDRSKLYTGAAQQGLGSKIPGLQKTFLETDEAQGKVDKQNVDLIDAKLKQSRQFLDGINTPEQFIAWHEGNHRDPVLGPELASRGVTAEQSRATIMKAMQTPGGFEDLLKKSALGLEKFIEQNKPTYQTSDSGQVTTTYAIPGLGGAPKPIISTKKVQSHDSIASNEITRRGQNMTDSRARDRLAFEQGNQVADAGGPSQAAYTKQFGKPSAGYRWKADGSQEFIPGGPADQKAQMKTSGEGTVDSVVADLRDKFNQLNEGGGVTSIDRGAVGNVGAGVASSGIGQATGRMFGTKNQSSRNSIAMTRPLLLQAIMKATGMSAKQMDSNAELKLYLSTATDPTLDLQANMDALDRIEKLYGSGQNSAVPAKPASKVNPIDSLLDKYK